MLSALDTVAPVLGGRAGARTVLPIVLLHVGQLAGPADLGTEDGNRFVEPGLMFLQLVLSLGGVGAVRNVALERFGLVVYFLVPLELPSLDKPFTAQTTNEALLAVVRSNVRVE